MNLFLSFQPSHIAQSVAYVTLEQEVDGSILARPIFFLKIDDSYCDRIHSPLNAVHCLDNGYVGKQPVAWTEYCAEYWLTIYRTANFWTWPNWEHLQTTKLNVAKMTISVYDTVENTVSKRRKCWLPAFSSFTTVFSKASLGIVWQRVKRTPGKHW